MQVRVLTMRYQGAFQGFSEDELRKATFGREPTLRQGDTQDARRGCPSPVRGCI